MSENHLLGCSNFFAKAINELAKFDKSARILDFGCGRGQLVKELKQLGFNAYGCDHWLSYNEIPQGENFRKITTEPYRLPFSDNSMDIVVSTSVFEHAQNTKECFQEIYRVLRPGGFMMNILPGKWYLPIEPHIYVPLVNWFWPKCPYWWLKLWAFLGIRNEFQKNSSSIEIYKQNKEFCAKGLCYRSTKYYNKISKEIFGNISWPMEFFIKYAEGGFNRLARKLPQKKLLGFISREVRMGFMVACKQ